MWCGLLGKRQNLPTHPINVPYFNCSNHTIISAFGKFSGIATLQEADKALRHVRSWVRDIKTPTTSELQGLPRLAWQRYNQLSNLYFNNDFICRQFVPNDDSAPTFNRLYLDHVLIPKVLKLFHSSSAAGHLGNYKVIE